MVSQKGEKVAKAQVLIVLFPLTEQVDAFGQESPIHSWPHTLLLMVRQNVKTAKASGQMLKCG